MKDFKGRVAVVTGGASGVGLALARAFLGAGMKVAIADVEAPALARAREALGAQDGELLDVVCDVSKREAVDALAEQVYERFGACHVLCNNAGVSVPNLNVWDTTPNDWLWVHGVNVRGVANGVQAFVPRMLAAGEPGVVMNTSSGDGGLSPFSEQVVYASSKAAVSILTECLHAQLTGQGTKLRAAVFYPSGGMLNTGIWTTKRNRPQELAREAPTPDGAEMTFDEFMAGFKKAGVDIPVQDLDELAQFALQGLRNEDFVIMIGREQIEAQLTERARKLAAGECPIVMGHPAG